MKRRWLRRRTAEAPVSGDSINNRKSLGRLAALFALIAAIVLAAFSTGSLAAIVKDKTRKVSAKSTASASAKSRVRRRRGGSFTSAWRKKTSRKKKVEVARKDKDRDEREELEGKEEPNEKYEALLEQEEYWANRVTYPTGEFDPAWVQDALKQDSRIERALPAGTVRNTKSALGTNVLSTSGFTALGPAPLLMTGCSGCFDYGITAGRVNSIAIDPTTTTPGSIVAYIATVGGGVWKTTNCCSALTSWTATTEDSSIPTLSVDTVVIDPNDHNTVYAGTGDLNYGSFSMGSQGILKSTNAGATWTVLGGDVFGAGLPLPAGQFPQYQAVGKVRVDPNDSNKVVAGTKSGLYISYDAGTNWTGPCTTNSFSTQRQDITGLELSNIGGTTRILAAVGVRGFSSTVQYNLDQNGANGLYKGTMPASGCPADFTLISRNDNGFNFGTAVSGSPYTTGNLMNAGSGTPYGGNISTGNQLGRMDIAVAPSDPNYIYAQVGSIIANNNTGCGNAAGCQIGVWASNDGGNTWTFMTGSAGGSLRQCGGTGTQGITSGAAGGGDYPQNWYDQAIAVDPNNPDRIFVDTYDTWVATRTGTAFYNVTCGYNGSPVANHVVHVDHHALAFVPGSSSMLLEGSDGGIFMTANANVAQDGVARPTWVNMDTGLNTIEFYSGDISGFFATSPNPQASGGSQDNGSMSVTFAGSPTGPVQWQMGRGGDGFYSRIDPVGTGTSLRFWQGNNSGSLARCISNCTSPGATWTTKNTGGHLNDVQSFILPYDLFHGDVNNPANDCGAAGAGTGCGHLILGTVRVWETIQGASANANGTVTWYVNSPDNLTKGTLGNRSFINQLTFEPSDQSVVIVGTNDGNVQIGRGMGSGSGPLRAVGTITMAAGGAVAGETFVVGSQTFTWQTAARSGPGQVQTSTSSTTSATNVRAAINADLVGVVTAGGTGSNVTVTAASTGAAGNNITFTEASTNMTMNGSGKLGGTTSGSDGVAVWTNVTDGNTVLPNRPILDVAFDPKTTNAPIGYAAVGGFDQNTPSTPGHVFKVTCTVNCASFTWENKTGNLPNIPVDSIIANPNFPQQVFAGTDIGLYYTDDIRVASPVWYRFNAGLPNVMIWDMQIDRGNTTLSLWTRGRGAFVWPLPLAPITPLATATDAVSGSGAYGSTATLSATLTEGGFPLAGKTVDFTLNSNSVGSAVTDANGVATLSGVSLTGIEPGSYPGAVVATFAGDTGYLTSNNSGALTVTKAVPSITWANPADIVYGTALDGTQLNATANVPGSFTYTPAAGTVLSSGNNQQLHVDFTPTDTAHYDVASDDAAINVLSAVLSVTMTADRNPAPVGLNFNYKPVVSNTGNASATNAVLTDVLPTGVTYTAASASQGTCSYASATRTVTCNLGTIGTGSTVNVQITVKPREEGSLNNTATVTALQWDPATGNSSASVNGLPAIKQTDLSASMSNTPDPIFNGGNTTYTVVVKNNSTVTGATGVALTDTLPASMTFVSATTSQGSLVTPPVGSTGAVTANLGSLATGATATVTITVKATASGVITNSATASGNESDPNAANNTSSQATTVKDAALQKVLLAKQVLIGGCENTTGTVYLTGPAGPGGVTVNLSTTSLAGVTVPASVFIPEGQTVSPAFNVTTTTVATKQVGTVNATAGTTVSRGLTVNVGSGVCPP